MPISDMPLLFQPVFFHFTEKKRPGCSFSKPRLLFQFKILALKIGINRLERTEVRNGIPGQQNNFQIFETGQWFYILNQVCVDLQRQLLQIPLVTSIPK